MSAYTILEGSPGLRIDEIAHIMVPGRGRDTSGHGLSEASAERTEYGGKVYNSQRLAERAGKIVCSGYKTPADHNGTPWSPEDAPHEVYAGIPEADSMRHLLTARGVPPGSIVVERQSIDTVTNFAFTEQGNYFGEDDSRPVAVVAQLQHLERMLKYIAPKTLRRDYLGIVVPEANEPEPDGFLPGLVSRVVLAGMEPGNPNLSSIVHRRAKAIWRVVSFLKR